MQEMTEELRFDHGAVLLSYLPGSADVGDAVSVRFRGGDGKARNVGAIPYEALGELLELASKLQREATSAPDDHLDVQLSYLAHGADGDEALRLNIRGRDGTISDADALEIPFDALPTLVEVATELMRTCARVQSLLCEA